MMVLLATEAEDLPSESRADNQTDSAVVEVWEPAAVVDTVHDAVDIVDELGWILRENAGEDCCSIQPLVIEEVILVSWAPYLLIETISDCFKFYLL